MFKDTILDHFIREVLIRIDDYYQLNNEFPTHALVHPATLQLLPEAKEKILQNFSVGAACN